MQNLLASKHANGDEKIEKAQGAVELVRRVVTVGFADPFTAQISEELTFKNSTDKSVKNVEILKRRTEAESGHNALYSNLRFYSADKNRLELLPGNTASAGMNLVLKVQIAKDEQQTIYMEYVHSLRRTNAGLAEKMDPKTIARRLLFTEPKYDFPFKLGGWSTYVFVQPAPRLLLQLDRQESIMPAKLMQIIAEPPRRNALYIRFNRFPTDPVEVKGLLEEYWKSRGIIIELKESLVRISNVERPWYRIIAKLSWIPLLNRLPQALFHRYEKEVASVSRSIVENRQVRTTIRQSIPSGLRFWFYLILMVGVAAGIWSPVVTVSASVIGLLAVTRSWLFYEEEMMKRAGYLFLLSLALGFTNILGLLVYQNTPVGLLEILYGRLIGLLH